MFARNKQSSRKVGLFTTILPLALLALISAAQPLSANPVLIPGVWTNITPPAAQIGPAYGLNYFTQGITIDPNNSSTLYFCVTGYNPSNFQSEIGGIWKSTDAGATWNVNSALDAPIHILINPNNSNNLYAVDGVRGNTIGFWVSTDAGNTWTQPAGFLNFCNTTMSGQNYSDGYSIAADPTNFNHVLYSSHSQSSTIAESTDGGNTWVAHSTPAVAYSGGYGVFMLYDPAAGVGNAQTWMFDSQTDGMYRTTNSGTTWTALTSIASMVHGGNQIFYTNTGVLITGSTAGVIRSKDNGATWQLSNYTNGVIGLVGDGVNLYTETYNGTGTFATSLETDGLTWTPYSGQPVYNGPFEMKYDSVNGIVYGACDEAGVFALKVPAGGVPAAPTGLTGTYGNGQASLNWTAAGGATSYNVLISAVSGTGYSVAASGISSTSCTITGLTNGQAYYFVVAAANSHGSGIISNETYVVPTSGSALNRSGWTVTASASGGGPATNAIDGNINTRWSTGADQVGGEWYEINLGSQQSFYQIILDTGPSTSDYPRGYSVAVSNDGVNWSSPIATGTPTGTLVVVLFSAQTAQYIKVTQTGSTSTGWWSEGEINVFTGSAGSSAGSDGSHRDERERASLTVVDGEFRRDQLQRLSRHNLGGESGTAIAAGLTTTSYTNTSLTNGSTYYYTVKALNSIGTSGASNEAVATPTTGAPSVPTGLTASSGNSQVVLSWTASGGATTYNVLRSTVSGSGYASVATGVSSTSYTNTGLANGTTYYFVVAAVNSQGTSGNSSQASATPSAGSGSVSNGTYKIVSLLSAFALDDPSGGGAGTGVDQQAYSGAGQQWQVTNVSGSYYKIICAVNGLALSGPTSEAQLVMQAYTGATTQLWSFTASGSNYVIANESNAQVVDDFNGSLNSGTVIGQWPSNGGTNQSWTLMLVSGSAPSAPTGLTATPSSGQVALSWTTSSGATSYNVYRGTSTGGESATAIVAGITTTAYTNTGLTNGTTYYFTVKALNSGGTSGASNEASGTPSSGGSPANGRYKVVCVLSGLALDDPSGGGSGTGVDQQAYSGSDQQWQVTSISGGYYEIACSANGLALSGPTAGAQLVVQAYTGAAAQLWSFTASGSNYVITNKSTGQVVDDFNAVLTAGNPIGQWTGNGGSNQSWTLTVE